MLDTLDAAGLQVRLPSGATAGSRCSLIYTDPTAIDRGITSDDGGGRVAIKWLDSAKTDRREGETTGT